MKLKNIVPYCLNLKQPSNEAKYYWIINGLTYTFDSLETQDPNFTDELFNYDSHFDIVNYIHLSRCSFVNPNETKTEYNSEDNYLVLNLENEITIFDSFILVNKTTPETTQDENKIFQRQNYYIANDHRPVKQDYTIGLFHTDPSLGDFVTNLRTLFKDLIDPPVPPKPVELTLEEKVDVLIDELMKDSRTMAIKKLRRMLNDRL